MATRLSRIIPDNHGAQRIPFGTPQPSPPRGGEGIVQSFAGQKSRVSRKGLERDEAGVANVQVWVSFDQKDVVYFSPAAALRFTHIVDRQV